MANNGIDTAIVIRSGYGNKCIYPSKVLGDLMPVYEDLGEIFFSLADEFGIDMWLGTYDSGHHWMRGAWWDEVRINRDFAREAADRYGHHKSFKGWYLCHETSRNSSNIVEIFNETARNCKEALDRPVLISPFPQGAKQFSGSAVMGLDESFVHWDRIFRETKGTFDVCAFQDGQIHYMELPRFHDGIRELGDRYGVTIWSNVETFDRDMPIKFPPADWRYLRFKIEAAARVVDKIVSFELPHFCSPNSSWESGRNLWNRYAEWSS